MIYLNSFVRQTRNVINDNTKSPYTTQSYQLSVFVLLALFLGFESCETDEENGDNLTIYVRYCRETFKDDFQRFITQIRYLFFDEDGILQHVVLLQREIDSDLQHLSPMLPYGRYTLIAIGNREEHSDCEYKVGFTRMEEVTLATHLRQAGDLQGGCDPMYWGILPFEYAANKPNDYICDMSNIHCRLRVTVRWANHLPGYR
ncbi:MAG: FimB/Mfa2 family fimbrial subunit [Proteiniphilum sp.]